MPFHEVAPPPAGQFIPPPKAGEPIASFPPPGLFAAEIEYWRDQLDRANATDDEVRRHLAQEATEGLTLASNVPSLLLSTHSRLTAVSGIYVAVAHSRLMRELICDSEERLDGLASKPEDVTNYVDYDTGDPRRSGMHTTEAACQTEFGWELPVTDGQWYEGEAIYHNISRPATPTATHVREYRSRFGKQFPRSQFVSLLPRPKARYWNGESV